jgi:hypothetical protein
MDKYTKETMIDQITVRSRRGYKSLLTEQIFTAGDLICELPCTAIHSKPSQHTVETGEHRHIEIGILAYMNHSCSPNVIVDTSRMQVRALRSILPGDEMTFFYPSTEWEMVNPFICLCGSPNCIHVVAGAKFLSLSVLERYYINPHIRERITLLLANTDHYLVPVLL